MPITILLGIEGDAMLSGLVMLVFAAGDVQAGCGIFDEFVFAGGERERRGVEQAIEVALQPMFFAFRPIARSKLRPGTHVSSSISFRREGQWLVSEAEGTKGARSEANGEPSFFVFDGNSVALHQHAEPTRVTQTFTTRLGGRENVYDLSPKTDTLTLSVKITSPRLAVPVAYILTYARSPKSACPSDNARASLPISIAGK